MKDANCTRTQGGCQDIAALDQERVSMEEHLWKTDAQLANQFEAEPPAPELSRPGSASSSDEHLPSASAASAPQLPASP